MKQKRAVPKDDGWRMPDALWERIVPLLPPPQPHPLGCHKPPTDPRRTMDAIFFVLRSGARWHSLPACGFMPGSTANRWFKHWLRTGVLQAVQRMMQEDIGDSFGMDWSRLFRVKPPPLVKTSDAGQPVRRKKKKRAKKARKPPAPERKQWIGPHLVNSGIFAISEFAGFSRTTRDALLHYDRIGLLHPVFRGKANYRKYSSGQLATINIIRILQNIGLSLPEIKAIADARTPDRIYEEFGRQIEAIERMEEALLRNRNLLRALRESIHSVANIDESAITVQLLPKAAIILGGVNDYSQGGTDYDALFAFYKATHEKFPDLDLNYPVWGIFSRERVKRGDWKWPDRYYLHSPEGTDKRPSGLYAIGYGRGGYGQRRDVYERLVEYIDRNGLEICGDAYEEYPLNEVSISESDNYLMRVMIAVRETEVLQSDD